VRVFVSLNSKNHKCTNNPPPFIIKLNLPKSTFLHSLAYHSLNLIMKKGLIPSLIISVGGYLGYQLKLGEYSGNGEIREELRPAKKWYYYEVDKAYSKSETEVSRFINDMTKLGVQGTFHKIQLDNPDETKENTRYIIGKI